MKTEELTLTSQHDQINLSATLYIPEHPVGILQLVHGMAEHRERYYDFMRFCAQHGLIVMIHDHRGHGATAGAPENYGYFGPDGQRGIVADVHQVTQYLRERFPGLTLTLFGHSMGSLVVRCYMQKYDQDVDALIVCGSPSKRFGSGAGRWVVKLMQLSRGERHRSDLVQQLAFGNYNRKFGAVPSVNSWIVSDPAVVAAYDDDPRDGFVFTLNGFDALFGLLGQAYSKKGWQMRHPDAPIFFIAGADDPCIIDQKHFAAAVNFMRQRGYRDVASKLYPGMRHEILNEKDKQTVWQDVVSWIDQKVISHQDA